jgi:hypothetical protein
VKQLAVLGAEQVERGSASLAASNATWPVQRASTRCSSSLMTLSLLVTRPSYGVGLPLPIRTMRPAISSA